MSDKFVIGASPQEITKKIKLELDCPSDGCDYVFDVANIDWGLMMECPLCKNRTYNPTYDKAKYTRKQVILRSVGSFGIGVLAGLLANYIFNYLT